MTGAAVSEYQIEPCPLCQAPIIWAVDDRASRCPSMLNLAGRAPLLAAYVGAPPPRRPSPKLAFGAKLRQIHYETCVKRKTRKTGRR